MEQHESTLAVDQTFTNSGSINSYETSLLKFLNNKCLNTAYRPTFKQNLHLPYLFLGHFRLHALKQTRPLDRFEWSRWIQGEQINCIVNKRLARWEQDFCKEDGSVGFCLVFAKSKKEFEYIVRYIVGASNLFSCFFNVGEINKDLDCRFSTVTITFQVQ